MDHGVYSDSVGVLMCWMEGEVNYRFYSTLDTDARKGEGDAAAGPPERLSTQ